MRLLRCRRRVRGMLLIVFVERLRFVVMTSRLRRLLLIELLLTFVLVRRS